MSKRQKTVLCNPSPISSPISDPDHTANQTHTPLPHRPLTSTEIPSPFPQGSAPAAQGQPALPSWPVDRESCTALTGVNVAVPHGVDGVLALAVPLAEDRCSQLTGSREGGWVLHITHVDNLVGSIQGLEAPLVFLPEELRGGREDSLTLSTLASMDTSVSGRTCYLLPTPDPCQWFQADTTSLLHR